MKVRRLARKEIFVGSSPRTWSHHVPQGLGDAQAALSSSLGVRVACFSTAQPELHRNHFYFFIFSLPFRLPPPPALVARQQADDLLGRNVDAEPAANGIA